MISNNFTRNLMVLFAIMSILFIIPASFAGENNTISEISDEQLKSIDNNAVYVSENTGSGNATGSADDPVSSIGEGLSRVEDGGTIYLNGTFTKDGNFNLTLNATPDKITFTGIGNAVIDGNLTKSFALVEKGEYTFNHISFINNYKTGDDEVFGGAFQNLKGKLTFNDCIFENNIVLGVNKGHGGAIDNAGELIIKNCTFTNNIANVTNSSGFRKNSGDGGAISDMGSLYVSDTNFIENKALRNGGAIRTEDTTQPATIRNCIFEGNTGGGHLSGGSYGGAIYTWDCGLNVYNSIFKNNRIYDVSGYGGRGGAISLNRGTEDMTILYCQFINNTAGGKNTFDGQSICFDGVKARFNYCTLDTSIYSSSQSVNLDYNWWITDGDINSLIENLPSSSAVRTYAELKVSTDAEEIEVGTAIGLSADLYWNGTQNQNGMNNFPVKRISLSSNDGTFVQSEGDLIKGSFKTGFTPANENVEINVEADSVLLTYSLTGKENASEISIAPKEIFEGESAVLAIDLKNDLSGICLVDIDGGKYYAEIRNGKGEVPIPGLKSGEYDVVLTYSDNRTVKTLTVKSRLDSQMNVSVEDNIVNVRLAENATGNISVKIDGDEIANVEIKNASAEIPLKLSAGVYCLEVKYPGDTLYASKSIYKGVSIDKKATSITASSKSFKAKSKAKTLKAKTKNIPDGKKLTLKVNGKKYSAKVKNGIVKFSLKLSKKGKYGATIKFAGDDALKASKTKIKIKIK